jgi:hypothetical protein
MSDGRWREMNQTSAPQEAIKQRHSQSFMGSLFFSAAVYLSLGKNCPVNFVLIPFTVGTA